MLLKKMCSANNDPEELLLCLWYGVCCHFNVHIQTPPSDLCFVVTPWTLWYV